jgi:hypothetical protein
MVNILGERYLPFGPKQAEGLDGAGIAGTPPLYGPLTKETRQMTTFDDRKDAFEKRFAHDEELRFKAMARRNKLLGLWAAERLGKSGADAEAYAKSVIMADFQEAGDDDVLRKVRSDLEANGAIQGEAELRRVMTDLLERAIDEVKAGR